MLIYSCPGVFAEGGASAAYLCGYAFGTICFLFFFVFLPIKFLIQFFNNDVRIRRKDNALEEMTSSISKKIPLVARGEKVATWQYEPRVKAVKALLKVIEINDKWFERKYMCEVADEAMMMVREAIEKRSLKKIQERGTDEFLDTIEAEIKALKKLNRERVFEEVEVVDVDILIVKAAGKKTTHSYTALISVKSHDYTLDLENDDEKGQPLVVKGDMKKRYSEQQLWTFVRSSERWLIAKIQPSADFDDLMKAKCVVSPDDLETFKEGTEATHHTHVTSKAE